MSRSPEGREKREGRRRGRRGTRVKNGEVEEGRKETVGGKV